MMIKDPKQIVTPYAFEVHPDLLGLPLATPKRRMAALLLDLLIASILTALGAFFLAASASILFFWLAIRNRGHIWWKNLLRFGAAGFVSILVFSLTYSVMDDDPSVEPNENTVNGVIAANAGDVDWGKLAEEVGSMSESDSVTLEDKLTLVAQQLEKQLAPRSTGTYPDEFFRAEMILNLRDLGFAISGNDTAATDSLKTKIAGIIAFSELADKNERITRLQSQNKTLTDKNEQLTEEVENPSFLRGLKATAEDFGLSVGWVGVYFVLCLALFKGQTLGKRVLGLQVVRLNNKPIGLWYSFERFGGYFAGLATGLLGFFQIYWDSNRQGIHDKISSTVVIDTREKKMEQYASLRSEILGQENLLGDT